jgi:hypothetical protein
MAPRSIRLTETHLPGTEGHIYERVYVHMRTRCNCDHVDTLLPRAVYTTRATVLVSGQKYQEGLTPGIVYIGEGECVEFAECV